MCLAMRVRGSPCFVRVGHGRVIRWVLLARTGSEFVGRVGVDTPLAKGGRCIFPGPEVG